MQGIVLAAVFASTLAAAVPVVNRPVVNMYSRASDDADVVSQARFGENVTVLEASGEWLHIQTPDGYKGWVLATSLIARDSAYEGRASVSALFAHVYREKSVTRHAPVMTLPFEARLQVEDTENERWLEATLPDGRTAWVQRGVIRIDPQPIDPAAMLELSRRFLGLPYTWGGTSSFGYDCSGFTQMLLRQRGIVMPRDAHDQAAWDGVKAVEKANLEPGDLLFFAPSPEKITHTGMYIGSGEFIHATTHLNPVVQISRLEEEHWTKLYVSARRPK